MSRVLGTYRDGRIVLDSTVDWPDGARVAIVAPAEPEEPDSPEARAEWLARVDAVQPLELSPEDEAEIAAARAAVRQASLEAVRRQMGLAP